MGLSLNSILYRLQQGKEVQSRAASINQIHFRTMNNRRSTFGALASSRIGKKPSNRLLPFAGIVISVRDMTIPDSGLSLLEGVPDNTAQRTLTDAVALRTYLQH